MLFVKTHTIQEFKDLHKATEINVVKNPHTDKIFFTCGSTSGKVSKKGYAKPVISLCKVDKAEEGTIGEEFFMLHSASETNVIATL